MRRSVNACRWEMTEDFRRLRGSPSHYAELGLMLGMTRKQIRRLVQRVISCKDCLVLFDAVCETVG